jgi:hypothetical protein
MSEEVLVEEFEKVELFTFNQVTAQLCEHKVIVENTDSRVLKEILPYTLILLKVIVTLDQTLSHEANCRDRLSHEVQYTIPRGLLDIIELGCQAVHMNFFKGVLQVCDEGSLDWEVEMDVGFNAVFCEVLEGYGTPLLDKEVRTFVPALLVQDDADVFHESVYDLKGLVLELPVRKDFEDVVIESKLRVEAEKSVIVDFLIVSGELNELVHYALRLNKLSS